MGIFSSLRATTSGLAAQRVRMDVVSSNVANIDTTRAADSDGAYRRQVVRFADAGQSLPFSAVMRRAQGEEPGGVVLARVSEDTVSPMRPVYDPGHPDADEEGFVEYPNVDLVTEMTDLTSANRSYQANATVLGAIKQMALRALDIGNR